MSDRVAVLGGGVGGLSAAHELIERGFDVTVYERKDMLGGRLAAYRSPTPGLMDARICPENMDSASSLLFTGTFRTP